MPKKLNKITEQRIEQLLTQGKEIGPKLIRGATEDAYQTPFRLLGKFGKKKAGRYRPLSIAVTNGKYHGCFKVYEDGTRPLIEKSEKCYLSTNDPFWKKLKDVPFKVEKKNLKKKLNKRRTKTMEYRKKTCEQEIH